MPRCIPEESNEVGSRAERSQEIEEGERGGGQVRTRKFPSWEVLAIGGLMAAALLLAGEHLYQ